MGLLDNLRLLQNFGQIPNPARALDISNAEQISRGAQAVSAAQPASSALAPPDLTGLPEIPDVEVASPGLGQQALEFLGLGDFDMERVRQNFDISDVILGSPDSPLIEASVPGKKQVPGFFKNLRNLVGRKPKPPTTPPAETLTGPGQAVQLAGKGLKIGTLGGLGLAAVTGIDTATSQSGPPPVEEVVQEPRIPAEQVQDPNKIPPPNQAGIDLGTEVLKKDAGVDLRDKTNRNISVQKMAQRSPEVADAVRQLSEDSGVDPGTLFRQSNEILDLGLKEGLTGLIEGKKMNSEALRQAQMKLKNPDVMSTGEKIGLTMLYAIPIIANAVRGEGQRAQQVGQQGAKALMALEEIDRQTVQRAQARVDMLMGREVDIANSISKQSLSFSASKRQLAEAVTRYEERTAGKLQELKVEGLVADDKEIDRVKKVAALIMQGRKLETLESGLIEEVQRSFLGERAASVTKTGTLKKFPIAGKALDDFLMNPFRSPLSQQYIAIQEPFAQYVAGSLEPRTTDEDRAIQQLVNFYSPGDTLETARAKANNRRASMNLFIEGLGQKGKRILASQIFNSILEERGYIDGKNVKATDVGKILIRQDDGQWASMEVEDYVRLVNQRYDEDINPRLLFEVD